MKCLDNYNFATPMMQQYMELKKQYADCILFFRLGDFYEMFLEDAKLGSRILDITLTARSRGKDGKIPMAGVPYHAVNSYLSKLVKAGHKVAICEQVGEADGRTLVERQVVRIVTPGTILDENSLQQKQNNYLLALDVDGQNVAMSLTDVSTGHFFASQTKLTKLQQILTNNLAVFPISEIILSPDVYHNPRLLHIIKDTLKANIYCFQDWNNSADKAKKILKKHFQLETLSSLGLDKQQLAQKTSAVLLAYLQQTQQSQLQHIQTIKSLIRPDFLKMDQATLDNLEILHTIRTGENEGSLIHCLDQTKTAMGGRLLRNWLTKPLSAQQQIQHRLNAVEFLLENKSLREDLQKNLADVYDIERILSKLSIGVATPKDVIRLKQSLSASLKLKTSLTKQKNKLLKTVFSQIDQKTAQAKSLIEKTLQDDPPVDPKNGGLIKTGIDEKLDQLLTNVKNNKNWLADLEKQERQQTGISTLKVEFNKVYGFYIEVSKSNLEKVPAHYERKQTLVNSERYYTDELKAKEEEILASQEKANELEFQIFEQLIVDILQLLPSLENCAQAVAELDCLVNFAQIAQDNCYVKPEITSKSVCQIKAGRHPVVEQIDPTNPFVANDTLLNDKDHQLLLITGPNMAGKSVYIRQVAVITLMAHAGSFVPADEAKIPLTDQIFVRSGASDVITSGLSTFMVEMTEAAYILHHATDRSLIVMDEIGRGTSTYDGISLAWSIAEYLVTAKNKQAKTLFATHYHELQQLEAEFPQKIKNYKMAIVSDQDQPVFLHQLVPGAADHSFGIAVAKMAGVPRQVTDHACQTLQRLQAQHQQTLQVGKNGKKTATLPTNSKILQELRNLDIENLKPLEALNKLAELKKDLDE